jgi:hypothetical protein
MTNCASGCGRYAISRDWTWKAEYLYVDTGAYTAATPNLAAGFSLTAERMRESILRAGINFHF